MKQQAQEPRKVRNCRRKVPSDLHEDIANSSNGPSICREPAFTFSQLVLIDR